MTDLFHPPGSADDFARRPEKQEAFTQGWDAIVNSWLDDCTGLDGGTFYNPRTDNSPGQPNAAAVPWDAFPRFLEKWFESDAEPDLRRWQAAETVRPRLFGGQPLRRVNGNELADAVPTFHRQQDEYCEWFVHRDADGRISRVTFTSEGPEYWTFLAHGTSVYFAQDDERSRIVEGDLELVAELYREQVDLSVAVDDLVWPFDVAAYNRSEKQWYLYGRAGSYNPFNKWNTTHGAMHLTHPANTLGAEVTLAAQAATLRVDTEGKTLTDTEELICNAGYGDPNRSSDPSIGAGVNGMARDGLSISLADPVGLYLAGINLDAFEAPGGADLSPVWRVDRGVADRKMILRATFAPPAGAGYAVEDIRVTGVPISFGGQITDEIQMILTGLAKARGAQPTPQPPVAKCCQHPQNPGIETIVEPTDDCTAVNWDGLTPHLPHDAGIGFPEAVPPQSLAHLVEPDPLRSPLACWPMTGPRAPVTTGGSNMVVGPQIDGAPDEPVLAVDDIQGNVMPGFATKHQAFLGVRFGEAERDRARTWLGSLVGSIATLAQVNDFRVTSRDSVRRGEAAPASPTWTNIAFDAKGLAVLAPAVDQIRERVFLLGMTAESNLGDPKDPAQEGCPSRWVVGGTPENTPEAFLVLANDDEASLRRAVAAERESVAAAGLTVDYEQFGHVMEGDLEHFGFRDGISQVAARGRLSDMERHYFTRRAIDPGDPRALCYARPGRPLIWPGQFVFGYPGQNDKDAVNPGPTCSGGYPWMDNGSYVVFRRLRQDVGAFRRFLHEEAARLAGERGMAGLTPARLAALLVGRWPNGVALMRSPTGAEPDASDRFMENHFGFATETTPVRVSDEPVLQEGVAAAVADPFRTVPGVAGDRFGKTCPGLAHIRKVNPRDLQTDQGGPDSTLTFQVLRRGITWGDPYPPDPAEQDADDGQRGLLFLCCQTSIAKQFGTLNTKWMNRFDGPEGQTGHDLLVGQGSGETRQRSGNLPGPDGNPVPIATLSEWVIPTGGGYFFAPSITALRLFVGAVR